MIKLEMKGIEAIKSSLVVDPKSLNDPLVLN
jgi:hypothetical protein